MKKFIAAATAVALASTAAPAQAASLTEFKDEFGNPHCRIALNDAEKGPANNAERYTKTLTKGAQAVAYTEAFEATFPEAKAIGDAYISDPDVHLHLTHERASRQTPADNLDGRNAARAAAKAKLAPLGLKDSDADLYLDSKEGQQNPQSGGRTELHGYAHWYFGINGGSSPISKVPTNHVPGNFGKTEAVHLKFVPEWKRDAFASNLNETYFGKVINTLEQSYFWVLKESRDCLNGKTHVMFPSSALPLPDKPVTYQNTVLEPSEKKPPAPAPKPSLPDLGALSSEDGSPNVGAIIVAVIAVIALIGGLVAGLPNLQDLLR